MTAATDNVAKFPTAIERQLPCDIRAEAALLGAVMLHNELLAEARVLKPQEFYLERHRAIFAAMLRLDDAGSALDPITLESGMPEADDGIRAVLHEMDFTALRTENLAYYVELVRKTAQRRAILHVASRITEAALDPDKQITETLADAERHLVKIADATIMENGSSLAEAGAKWIEKIRRRRDTKGHPGITSGIARLDQLSGGWQAGRLIIVAARPKVGKSALAIQFADHAARTGHPVLFCSLEMSAEELAARALCGMTDTDGHRAAWGQLSDLDFDALDAANLEQADLPIQVEDSVFADVMVLRAKVRKFCRDNRRAMPLVVLDYLQLLGSSGKTENRTQELTKITRTLKLMARAESCPLIVLSQLNRGSATTNREPALHDLRESGSIEQDADLVLFLHPTAPMDEQTSIRDTALIVAANRHGPAGYVHTQFTGRSSWFQEIR